MQGLKILVVVMAFAIFAVIGVIIVTVSGRIGDEAAEVQGFGEIQLPLPQDCVIADVALGDDQRLAITIEGPVESGCRMIVIFDLEAGEEAGRVVLPNESGPNQ